MSELYVGETEVCSLCLKNSSHSARRLFVPFLQQRSQHLPWLDIFTQTQYSDDSRCSLLSSMARQDRSSRSQGSLFLQLGLFGLVLSGSLVLLRGFDVRALFFARSLRSAFGCIFQRAFRCMTARSLVRLIGLFDRWPMMMLL